MIYDPKQKYFVSFLVNAILFPYLPFYKGENIFERKFTTKLGYNDSTKL